MNVEEKNDPLDSLLCQWSDELVQQHDSGTPQVASLASLKKSVVDELFSPKQVGLEKAGPSETSSVWWAAAASLLLAASIAFSIWRMVPADVTAVTAPQSASLTEQDILAKHQLMQECLGLFGNQFHGAVEFDDQLEMNLSESSTQSTASDHGTLVRLVFARRPIESESWENIWLRDVIAMNENVIQLTNRSQQPDVSIWTYRLPDGNTVVDVDVQGTYFDRLNLSGSHRRMLEAGNPQSLACAKSDGFEFCLFQTAAPISAAPQTGGGL